jgi:hypothetical protein
VHGFWGKVCELNRPQVARGVSKKKKKNRKNKVFPVGENSFNLIMSKDISQINRPVENFVISEN